MRNIIGKEISKLNSKICMRALFDLFRVNFKELQLCGATVTEKLVNPSN